MLSMNWHIYRFIFNIEYTTECTVKKMTIFCERNRLCNVSSPVSLDSAPKDCTMYNFYVVDTVLFISFYSQFPPGLIALETKFSTRFIASN